MRKAKFSPAASLRQAQRMLAAGKIEKARSLLTRLCRTDPGNVDTLIQLAAVEFKQGKLDQAVTALQRVVDLCPDHAPSLTNLANLLAVSGRHEEAQANLRKVLALTPDDPLVLNNLGRALVLAGKPREAVGILTRAIEIRARYGEAHYNLAQALDAACRPDEAVGHYREALQLKPCLFEARLELANKLEALGKLADAEACFRLAVKTRPDSIEPYVGLARNLAWQGQLNQALTIYESLLRKFPGSPEGIVGSADILERKGDFRAAWKRLEPLIDGDGVSGWAAEVFARLCHRVDRCEQAATLGETLLERGSLSTGLCRVLHYALGSLYDRRAAYDEAFGHFERANALTAVRFDEAVEAEKVDRLVEVFQPAIQAQLPHATNASERPLFIVGMPRSGTTLVEQILAAHPKVSAAGELVYVNRFVLSLSEKLDAAYPECLGNLTPEFLDRVAEEYLRQLDGFFPDACRVTDKMPHNFWHLGVIELLFPGARVIHCVRDPLDTCLSIYFHDFNLGHSYATGLGHLGAYYSGYRRLMAHWKKVLDMPVFEVSYENLVAGQREMTHSLLEFCGLDWDERCLRFHRVDRVVSTLSYDQVRQPLYTKSIGRWKNYESHLEPLMSSLGVG